MTEEDKEILRVDYNCATERLRKVYEIFCDYFGEDKVDIQGIKTEGQYIHQRGGSVVNENVTVPFILVWFPEVTVTNENGRSVDIQDIYMKVQVEPDGSMNGSPTMNRATYPFDQFQSNYMHSHTPGINKSSSSSFQHICTGSGPIQATIGNLNGGFDEDLWQLFCSELEDFVHVESLRGGPYRRLEKIGIADNSSRVRTDLPYIINGAYNWRKLLYSIPSVQDKRTYSLIADFTRSMLKEGGLPLEFANGNYNIAMSYIDCAFYLSNKFIEWYNREDNPYRRIMSLQKLDKYGILRKHILRNEELYVKSPPSEPIYSYEGSPICIFKGTQIRRHIIIPQDSSGDNLPLLLCSNIIRTIVGAIVKVVNYRYGRKRKEQPESCGQAIYL